MKYLFQRGSGPLSAPADGTLFRFGKAPAFSLGPCYSCDWSGAEPTVILTHGSAQHSIALRQHLAFTYSFSHDACGLIYLDKCLWFEARPKTFGSDGILLSFQGWDQGLWHDGVYCRWRKGQINDLILPGVSFRGEWGLSSEPLANVFDWFADEKYFAQKQSLILAVQMGWGERMASGTTLELIGENRQELLSLLLFRLAFLQNQFFLLPKSSSWKRLAQNLNITPLNADDSRRPKLSMAIEWGPSKVVHDLLQWQLRLSPFIPKNLWSELEEKSV